MLVSKNISSTAVQLFASFCLIINQIPSFHWHWTAGLSAWSLIIISGWVQREHTARGGSSVVAWRSRNVNSNCLGSVCEKVWSVLLWPWAPAFFSSELKFRAAFECRCCYFCVCRAGVMDSSVDLLAQRAVWWWSSLGGFDVLENQSAPVSSSLDRSPVWVILHRISFGRTFLTSTVVLSYCF